MSETDEIDKLIERSKSIKKKTKGIQSRSNNLKGFNSTSKKESDDIMNLLVEKDKELEFMTEQIKSHNKTLEKSDESLENLIIKMEKHMNENLELLKEEEKNEDLKE